MGHRPWLKYHFSFPLFFISHIYLMNDSNISHMNDNNISHQRFTVEVPCGKSAHSTHWLYLIYIYIHPILSVKKDLKLRPIVAGPNCPTKRLSTLLDITIKPMIKHVKSYVRDSLDFLNKCSRFSNQNTILATFDITPIFHMIMALKQFPTGLIHILTL